MAKRDGSEPARVTSIEPGKATYPWGPRFSPDGTELVFYGLTAADEYTGRELYTVDIYSGEIDAWEYPGNYYMEGESCGSAEPLSSVRLASEGLARPTMPRISISRKDNIVAVHYSVPSMRYLANDTARVRITIENKEGNTLAKGGVFATVGREGTARVPLPSSDGPLRIRVAMLGKRRIESKPVEVLLP